MKRLVCLGDSLTEGSDLDRGAAWPALVGNGLEIESINCGIGGDTSGGLLGRFYPDVVRRKAGYVFILCGTNDLWWDVPVNMILANIFAMTCQARYHGITPLVGTPPPVEVNLARTAAITPPLHGFERCLQGLSELVEAIQASAAASDIPCLDLQSLFLNEEGNVLSQFYLEDGLHPNRAGHGRIADAVAQMFRTTFRFGPV